MNIRTSNTQEIPPGAKNGICLPVVRVDSVDYNLKELTRAELIELRALLDADIANIEMQFDSGDNGKWADTRWEARAKFARRMKAAQTSLIQAELSRRKEKVPSFHKIFMDLCFKRLDRSLFDEIAEASKSAYQLALEGA